MIRCSDLHRICTNKPDFNIDDLVNAELDLKETVEKKGGLYNSSKESLEVYSNTQGLVTKAKKVISLREKEFLAEDDPLPDGAKSYLQKLWLYHNYGFISYADLSEIPAIKKGIQFEDEAIRMLCEKEQIILTKNTDRYTTGFLTGEPDILQTLEERKIIRDIKIAENWETFRNVEGISSQYYYQGVGYCFLTNSSLFYLDYFLIPNYFNWEVPEKFLEMETAIGNLPLNKRIKTYAITSSEISQEIPFIINRLSKAHSYYNNLSYNICMKFN